MHVPKLKNGSFWHFTQNVKIARFARIVEWDFFCDFQTLWTSILFSGQHWNLQFVLVTKATNVVKNQSTDAWVPILRPKPEMQELKVGLRMKLNYAKSQFLTILGTVNVQLWVPEDVTNGLPWWKKKSIWILMTLQFFNPFWNIMEIINSFNIWLYLWALKIDQ